MDHIKTVLLVIALVGPPTAFFTGMAIMPPCPTVDEIALMEASTRAVYPVSELRRAANSTMDAGNPETAVYAQRQFIDLMEFWLDRGMFPDKRSVYFELACANARLSDALYALDAYQEAERHQDRSLAYFADTGWSIQADRFWDLVEMLRQRPHNELSGEDLAAIAVKLP